MKDLLKGIREHVVGATVFELLKHLAAQLLLGGGTVVGVILAAWAHPTIPIALLGALGGAVLTLSILTVVKLAAGRPEHPFECVEILRAFELSGIRGATTKATERMVLKAMTEVTAFPYMVRSMDGIVEREVVTLRDIKRGLPAIQLGPANVINVTQSGPTNVTILPPFPIRLGDKIELLRETHARDSFPRDDESVGKNIIYPTKKLSLHLKFSGCIPSNGVGTKVVTVPVDGHAIPIEAQGNGVAIMQWEVLDAKPGERYLLSWKWLG